MYTASEVLKNMNQAINPCDNFYKFVCGGFINSTIIPTDKDAVNYFASLQDQVIGQLNAILNEPTKLIEPIYMRNAKNFYKSCMNVSEYNYKEITNTVNFFFFFVTISSYNQ